MEQRGDVRIGGVDVRPTERTGLIGAEPSVYAVSMKGMAAEGEQPELIMRLELREADGAVPVDGGGGPVDDRGEGEEREGVENGGTFSGAVTVRFTD